MRAKEGKDAFATRSSGASAVGWGLVWVSAELRGSAGVGLGEEARAWSVLRHRDAVKVLRPVSHGLLWAEARHREAWQGLSQKSNQSSRADMRFLRAGDVEHGSPRGVHPRSRRLWL